MLCLVRIKGCKRCGGDLSLECDIYGVYAECIQCGANWSKTDMEMPAPQKNSKPFKVTSSRPIAVKRNQR
jgi:hypothetical protein